MQHHVVLLLFYCLPRIIHISCCLTDILTYIHVRAYHHHWECLICTQDWSFGGIIPFLISLKQHTQTTTVSCQRYLPNRLQIPVVTQSLSQEYGTMLVNINLRIHGNRHNRTPTIANNNFIAANQYFMRQHIIPPLPDPNIHPQHKITLIIIDNIDTQKCRISDSNKKADIFLIIIIKTTNNI